VLFNSYQFIFVFLPFSFLIYFYLLSARLTVGAKAFLVFASLFFYSWWNIAYLPLILASMLFNYVVGNSLNENFKKIQKSKKTLLFVGIAANLSLLGYYKYADFFIENVNLGLNTHIELLHLALPLAISFFTFQQIAYLVDSYRGETKEYDFLNYALFVTFFPQLIAGPIVHHKEMMPQFATKWNMVKNYRNIALGLFIFSMGLFKKVAIADTFAIWATNGFDKAQTLTLVEGWVTSLSYTFQLYFDFSGYTDMAIGAALLFNITLPNNFDSPYKAKDIQDFWRRWHITLSRFLRDYIYIPLGGNRNGEFRTYGNLMITFILGGFWHGAGWTFIFWGFLHGLALVIHRIWKRLGFTMHWMFAWFITFNFVNIAWVFFRAKEWDDAIKVLKGMFGLSGVILPSVRLDDKLLQVKLDIFKNTDITLFMFIMLIAGLFATTLMKNSTQHGQTFKVSRVTLAWTLSMALLSLYFMHRPTEFLYFNF